MTHRCEKVICFKMQLRRNVGADLRVEHLDFWNPDFFWDISEFLNISKKILEKVPVKISDKISETL